MSKSQKTYVRALFNSIAGSYDLLNHLLSAGVDLYWRRRAVAHLKDLGPRQILDVATGTGDFAIASLRLNPERVVGIDIAEEMLQVGRRKLHRRGLETRIQLETGDAENLSLPSGSFDAAIVAFGVRNFENLDQGLAGMYRVLREGGRIVVLEFSRPKTFPWKQLYLFYFRHILPIIGRAVSNHREAYRYLPDTVMKFPEGQAFQGRLEAAGFRPLRTERLTGGIATIYSAEK